jgi:AcrR family transcriptional regulator
VPPPSRARGGVRPAVTSAALELFSTLGYEETTVGAIADRAGVARRTFFRHFATKDDAVLPDHDTLLARVQARLEASGADADPLAVLGPAAHVVLDAYLAEGQLAVDRYGLLSRVPELRERERAVVTRYQRVFARYLRAHLPPSDDRDLRAEVLAASLVAAHNHVLRAWLRSPIDVDAGPMLDDALAAVLSALSRLRQGDEEEPVFVAVFRSSQAARAIERLRALVEEPVRPS